MHGVYVCPRCKRELKQTDEGLRCDVCAVTYPIFDGIPDFLLEDLSRDPSSAVRNMQKFDWLASIYETRMFYPLVLNLLGGWRSVSLERLRFDIADIIGSTQGQILDVACGPATYGRRIASESREVYGIDVSMGMLRRGVQYVKRECAPNVHFARAKVEALPFPGGLFDAAICAGSLHLFPDPVLALCEIGRTIKAGAPLAVMTFAAGISGISKYQRVRRHLAEAHGFHIFEPSEVNGYLAEAGFEDFQPHAHGSILVFRARKKMVQ